MEDLVDWAVGVKDCRTKSRVENGVNSTFLHPYECENTITGGKWWKFHMITPAGSKDYPIIKMEGIIMVNKKFLI